LTTRSPALDQAVSYASGRGVLVVAAAGNRSQPNLDYPSLQKEALGITGVDSNDVKADFSNWGPQADVSAPAVSLYSSYGDGQLAWWSGTSFAVPLVCGEAALILSIIPTATVNQLVSIITSSPDNIDDLSPMYAKSLGAGRINCLSAVKLALR
ncbi:MAG: alkaline serine protease, partial [Acidobacteria bacterium]